MGVEDQTGSKNHMFGKPSINAKRVKAEHKEGTTYITNSIRELSDIIHIDRANIRNLIKKNIRGKMGWSATLV